jgi:hypothetical protein
MRVFGRPALAPPGRPAHALAMRQITSISLIAAALFLGACGNATGPGNGHRDIAGNRQAGGGSDPTGPSGPRDLFGPDQAMAGTYVTRFEHAEFNGCWLSMTPEAAADFRRRFPIDGAESPRNGGSYALRIIGRHSIDAPSAPPSYGHMGGWRCEIRVTRFISAEFVGERNRPRDGETGRIRKGEGDARQGLDAGHDQAMLEELRRRAGQ